MTGLRWLVAGLAMLAATGSCASSSARDLAGPAAPAESIAPEPVVTGLGGLRVASPDFAPGGALPDAYRADSPVVRSPTLEWSNVINAAAELAVVVRSSEVGVLWVVGGIDPGFSSLDEGSLPRNAVEYPRQDGRTGWDGVPAVGGTISFTLHVLDRPLRLDPSVSNVATIIERRSLTSATVLAVP